MGQAHRLVLTTVVHGKDCHLILWRRKLNDSKTTTQRGIAVSSEHLLPSTFSSLQVFWERCEYNCKKKNTKERKTQLEGKYLDNTFDPLQR